QVGILLVRRADDPPVGRDDLGPKQIVAAEPRCLRKPADAAAEGKARHAGVADDAAGGRKAMLLSRRVHVAQVAPPPHVTRRASGSTATRFMSPRWIIMPPSQTALPA